MDLKLVVLSIVGAAVMVVGLIEWVKGWPAWKKTPLPGWFPSVASPILCLAAGQLVAPLVLPSVALFWLWGVAIGLLALAVTELAYQIIVQSIPQVLSGIVAKVAPPASPTNP